MFLVICCFLFVRSRKSITQDRKLKKTKAQRDTAVKGITGGVGYQKLTEVGGDIDEARGKECGILRGVLQVSE